MDALLLNKTEGEDASAARINIPLIPGALRETPLVQNHSGRNRMIFMPDLSILE
jgi:hypothetical protein